MTRALYRGIMLSAIKMSTCRLKRCYFCAMTPFPFILRGALWLLAIGVSMYLLKTYIDWGLWNRELYQQMKVCSEKYINIENHHLGDIFSDRAVHQECEDIARMERERMRNDVRGQRTTYSVPTIATMCSTVKPELLSHVRIVSNHVNDSLRVPNTVHYVTFNRYEWSFLNYLSVRSVHINIKPRYIFIHGDDLPYGPWWTRTLQEVPNIYHVTRERPERIQGKVVRWIEHATDIIRIQTVLLNGGIYLDTDIIALRSFDALRKYPTTLGRESRYGLGSGIIIAEPRSRFMCVWAHAYRDYSPWPWHWALYAVWTPHWLARTLADDIHIEEDTLHSPTWQESHKLFHKTIDWSGKYAIHVWHRYGHVPARPEGPDGIGQPNTTLGEIMRLIYYGSKDQRLEGSDK